MVRHNHEIIKVSVPVLPNVPIEMSSASSKIHKAPSKHKMSDNALTHIQSQGDILKEKIEKTNTYYLEFKHNINKKLKHKNIREGDENEISYERIVVLEKENNCLKNEIKHEQLIVQMLTSNENGYTHWKSSKSINPDLLDKLETPTSINLTNRFESRHVEEENSKHVDKNNDLTLKYTILNDKPKSSNSLWHTSEQGHRKKLVQHNKSINDANRRPVVVNSHPENDKLNNKLKGTVQGNTT